MTDETVAYMGWSISAQRHIDNFRKEVRELKAENAKLRELVKKLVILAFARCADCDLLDASCSLVPAQRCLLWNECESIARELGVEVDG